MSQQHYMSETHKKRERTSIIITFLSAVYLFESHQEASTHFQKSAQLKSGRRLPVEELVKSTEKYLASAESGLNLAAAVNLAHLPLCYAFFTQFQEASYPPKQGPGSLLQLCFFPWILPQMSAQHTLLRGAGRAHSLGKTVLKFFRFETQILHHSCLDVQL